MPGSKINSHSRMVIWVILLLMTIINLYVECVQQQHQKQQYSNNKNNSKNNNKAAITIKYNRLLSIQRQIMMTEQMVKLYTDRLGMLYELKRGYQQQQKYQEQNKHVPDVAAHVPDVADVAVAAEGYVQQKQQQQYFMDNPYYILTNQYTISTIRNKNISQEQQNNNNNNNNNNYKDKQPIQQQHIVILPPFIINKRQSYVTVIENLNFIGQKHKLKDDIDDSNKVFYDYSHATRLLFYQLLDQENNRRHPYHNQQGNQQQSQQHYQQMHKLQLTLQIKPNKIKIVTITCLTIINSNNNIKQSSRFIKEQKVTSYQSHPLITTYFKWHHAIQFDNLIIGYKDSIIYVKNKQANDMKTIDIDSYNVNNLNQENGKILALYSINQYKVMFVSQYCIGVVNVRSYLVHNNDEIRYEYYLGNMTMVRQRTKQQQEGQREKEEQNNKRQEQQQKQTNNNNNTTTPLYWHTPYTRQYSKIRALSVQRIPQTNQLMILLSNGQILMYKNGRIQHSVNIKQQVMREFSVNRGNNKNNNMKDNSNKDNDMKIKITLLPGYNYAILTSNKHNKLLIYNITIPRLTRNSNSNTFFAFLQPKVNSLKFQYWMAIDVNINTNDNHVLKKRYKGGQTYKSNNNKYQYQQMTDIKVSYNNQKQQQQVVIYLSYNNFHQQKNKMIYNQSNQSNNQQQQSSQSLTTTIIYQYSLLLNLLSQQSQFHTNSIITNNNNSQQQTTKSSYWWNVLMVSMIVLGVVCFRKCKQINSSNGDKNRLDEESLLYQLPQGYRRRKRETSQGTRSKANSNSNQSIYKSTKPNDSNSNNSNNKFVQNKNSTQPSTSTSQSQTSPSQPHQQQYQQKVIQQLQSYLQKQGQKLSRQQIIQLIQQMQSNQQQQQQLLKQQQQQQQHQLQLQRPKRMTKQEQKTTKNIGSLQKKKKR